MKTIHKIINLIIFLITMKNSDAVNEGICDYSGQGKDKYGN